jgi:molybdopterin synthase sulfur carrier subunit
MSERIDIQVEFSSAMKESVGQVFVKISLNPPATVRGALEFLVAGQVQRDVLFEGQDLRPDLLLLINGRNISFIGGLDATLESGDVLAIFPPTFGG